MNFSCIFLLALALFGAVTHAYIGSGAVGYGAVGALGYGSGYGVGYETGCGCGCRTACAPAVVSDTCQCLKTVVRPVVETIPYTCSRRVHAPACRTTCGAYSGGIYGGAGAVGGYGGYLY